VDARIVETLAREMLGKDVPALDPEEARVLRRMAEHRLVSRDTGEILVPSVCRLPSLLSKPQAAVACAESDHRRPAVSRLTGCPFFRAVPEGRLNGDLHRVSGLR